MKDIKNPINDNTSQREDHDSLKTTERRAFPRIFALNLIAIVDKTIDNGLVDNRSITGYQRIHRLIVERLLKPLVFAIISVLVLYDLCRFRHLFVINVLFVAPVVTLY